jgi:hypothetical protein
MAMIEIYKPALRAASAILCASLMTSAYASPPTIAGVWQQIDSGTGYVGGLINFKEKGRLWNGYIDKMYPSLAIRWIRFVRAARMTARTSGPRAAAHPKREAKWAEL